MQTIAMYLPQFHRVKENDEWWGEGFTDWVSAQKASPLFEGHYQPHIPLKNNYYDLLDKKTMEWQANLMQQYGIDGVCMYHYYFKDGRKILEKPAENLLQWKDINMPFCFSWANETWARSWSNLSNINVWSNLNEPEKNKEGKAVLLEQRYGDEEAWKEHFRYLLPFFSDPRYIRVDGKPLFLIYKASLVPCLTEMISCFQEWARESGLSGLYIIGSNCTQNNLKILDGELFSEPVQCFQAFERNKWTQDVTQYKYEDLWNIILSNDEGSEKTYYGGFVGYDDTPRRGKSGVCVTEQTPELFAEKLAELMAKNSANGKQITFINAWNEWGEGMHLEPDEKDQEAYLASVATAKQNYSQYITKYEEKQKTVSGMEKKYRMLANKFEINMNALDSWMKLKENDISLAEYFIGHQKCNIFVYGYGILAKHLLTELEDTEIKISGIVDMQGNKIKAEYPVFFPSKNLPKVDLIVVTTPFYYEEIVMQMGNLGIHNVISLTQIIDELGQRI